MLCVTHHWFNLFPTVETIHQIWITLQIKHNKEVSKHYWLTLENNASVVVKTTPFPLATKPIWNLPIRNWDRPDQYSDSSTGVSDNAAEYDRSTIQNKGINQIAGSSNIIVTQ